jgi:dTDP-4-amino-4,6-dideoxygalactose transaminase
MLYATIARLRLRTRFPGFLRALVAVGERIFPRQFGRYPRPLAGEIGAVRQLLRGSQWNMSGGKIHEQLESEFATYVGAPHAIAVNTGGMALQMSLRALGFKPGNEVLMQVDTCSATAFAVMNAGCTPIFSDISPRTFMLPRSLPRLAAEKKGLIATHMWGNPEDMVSLAEEADRDDLILIEDACLALGARINGKMAGTSGKAGVFSFGRAKPIQAGEGGMIVTRDEALARELRSLRHWGDRTLDFGVRDTTQLAWNGRMSEILAAMLREQLKGYPAHLRDVREGVQSFERFLQDIDGVELVLGNAASVQDCAFTQITLRLDEQRLKLTKVDLRRRLAEVGINCWHANFEAIPSLSFFKNGTWRDWIFGSNIAHANANYSAEFPVHNEVFDRSGLGIAKMHFASHVRVKDLKSKFARALAGR